jgi:hypothetical protein
LVFILGKRGFFGIAKEPAPGVGWPPFQGAGVAELVAFLPMDSKVPNKNLNAY